MIENKIISPFKRFCVTIGLIPSSFAESMTYYECLNFLSNYINNNLIPATNANSEAITELQTYVQNYFDNLDVQEEINNKLDDMAESGQLAEIIAQYLSLAGVLAFDTIADLQSAENIEEGSICLTLGQALYNDGKTSFYKVRTITSGDVIDNINIVALNVSNTLIAEKIINTEYARYNNEKLTKLICEYDSDIGCFYEMLRIKRDKFSLKQVFQNAYSTGIYDYLKNTENCFVVNGQLAGVDVSNGLSISEATSGSQYWYILGVDENGDFMYTQDLTKSKTSAELIALGYKEAFGIWSPVMINGEAFNISSNIPDTTNDYDYIINGYHPRTILGYDNDYIYILTIEGRLANSKGANYSQIITLCQKLNIANAFNLDGGGSTQLWTSKYPKNLTFGNDKKYIPYRSRNLHAMIKFEKEV